MVSVVSLVSVDTVDTVDTVVSLASVDTPARFGSWLYPPYGQVY